MSIYYYEQFSHENVMFYLIVISWILKISCIQAYYYSIGEFLKNYLGLTLKKYHWIQNLRAALVQLLCYTLKIT